ncbi:DegT/DnrJ/EryC1/StrS aminotransferase family protein [Cypionkella sp.]|uniref:DegT/DnrJ/EryC1/StrS family aminotransferase n=1 Tax=Cypionkella sp. TaxID=2811411 RepID=UPI002634033A|nr:DegT/DnrJ/EryC1/StrS aminotransferase family protein [Cypionkella sp.]MDB5666386.1 aminotransferase DegT [Cypionkella sp.]
MLLVAEPVLGREECAAVIAVLESGWITLGERVRTFERAFAELHGVADAVAVDSCTAGLHLVLKALGVGPGDEVLAPSLTFVATVNAILYVGADPVLVDIEALQHPLMSIKQAEAKITPRTRAIMLMHYAGHMAEMRAWRDFAARHGLLLIEDAAHAVGVAGVGKYGDGSAFSFYGNKNMTTAEGGMVIMHRPEMLERVRQLRGHGMTRSVMQRLVARTPHYDVDMLGYNYRMDEIRGAIGLVQLSRLEAMNSQRAALVGLYRALLNRLENHYDGFVVPRPQSGLSAHHIMPVLLPVDVNRDRVAAEMDQAGVQTTIHYPPVHTLSYYRQRFPGQHLPLTEEFHRRELTLPLHPKMDESDVELVVNTLETALESAFAPNYG